MASSSNSDGGYNIFLSFRGSDTRKKFTDHLYNALKREGYRTFRDDDEIERGENIKFKLREAIRHSEMSVIVLSKNFADSTACLFELLTILEQWKTHRILPVFYDVDPSEIKEQAEKLDFKNTTIEQVKVWSAALKEIASMAGIVSLNQSNGYEATLIEDILECIRNKIGDPSRQPHWHPLRSLLQDLDSANDYLSAQAEDVRAKVCSEMNQMWKKPKKEVQVWLRDVASLKDDVEILKQEVLGESSGVHSSVQLRKILEEKIQKAAELQEKGRSFNDNLLVAFPIDRVLWMPPTNLESVEARNAESIWEYLRETLFVM